MQQSSNENVEKQNTLSRILLSVGRLLLILGLLFYVFYHLTNGFSTELKTEMAVLRTEEILLATNGVIVRNETAVGNASGGVVSYIYKDGERVAVSDRVAIVYSGSQDAQTIAKVAEIDKIIELLESADIDEDTRVSDGIAAGKDIANKLANASEHIARGDFGKASEEKDLLVKSFVRRGIILSDTGADIKAKIVELKDERAALAAKLVGGSENVNVAMAGYFYTHADGAEKVFDYANIKKITPAEYHERAAAVENTTANAVGKIVTQAKWYYVSTAEKQEALGLTVGKKYTVDFGISNIRVDMTLEAKNEGGEEVALVFSSFEMPEDFDFDRIQRASIVKERISGYKVPSSALRLYDGMVGVYIRSGNTVKFRVADVIYESGAYSFISANTETVSFNTDDEDKSNDIYYKGLSLYDNVVVGGARELFPDRIVN